MDLESAESSAIFADRYEILGLLGRGGMGDVFLAKDTLIGSTLVVLKVLFHDNSKNKTIAERFIREIQATRMISHPNVVRTFDFGSFGKRMYFTMEYVQGITLEKELEEAELSNIEALKLFYQLSLGLKAIHETGITHRDIKPSNIIIGIDGIAKYNDFGIAHLKDSSLTQSCDLLGTSLYMAPELFTSAKATSSIDVYSLGIIAYEMFTDSQPFKCANEFHLQYVKKNGAVLPPINKRPELPNALNDLVVNMLSADSDQRIKSSELASELELIAYRDFKISKDELLSPYEVKSQIDIETEDLNFGLILNTPPKTSEKDTLSKSLKDALSRIAKTTGLNKISPSTKKRLSLVRFSIIICSTLFLGWYVLFSNSFKEKLHSPGGVTGLTAWYTASNLNLKEGSKVSNIIDSSLNKIIASQSEKDHQPTFHTDLAYGHPVMAFDGENDFLEADKIALDLRASKSITLIYVAKVHEKNIPQFLLSAQFSDKTSNLFSLGSTEDKRIRIQTARNSISNEYYDSYPINNSELGIYSIYITRLNVTIYHNGKKLYTGDIKQPTDFTRAFHFSIGQKFDQKQPANFFKGEIAEILVYNRLIPCVERRKIQNLLSDKYRIKVLAD